MKALHTEIQVGFNLFAHPSGNSIKGIKDQIAFIDTFMAARKAQGYDTKNIVLRIMGGTGSQTHRYLWTMPQSASEIIAGYNSIQQKYGCKYIFTVDYNSDPDSEFQLYIDLTDAGLEFSAIELGNEQYLFKYKNSDYTKEEVTIRTSAMTPYKYFAMADEYIDAFGGNIPFWVQLAPTKGTPNQREYYNLWNDVALEWLSTRKTPQYAATQHIYDGGDYDFPATKALRDALGTTNLHITEFGARNDEGAASNENPDKLAIKELDVTKKIQAILRPGDSLVWHMLWNDYKEPGRWQALFWQSQINPKGTVLMPYIFPDKTATTPPPTSTPGTKENLPPGTSFFRKLNIKGGKSKNVLLLLIVAGGLVTAFIILKK